MRRIDPEAEAARLTAQRSRGAAHLLCDEMQQVTGSNGDQGLIYIKVTSTLPPDKLTTALGVALGDLVREHCYGGSS